MSKLCEQIIVAILLAVIVGVPLILDVRIYSVFDLSKITLLYLLVFSAIIVFCIKQMIARDRFNNNPLMLPLGCLLAVSFFATIFSINPLASLLGGYKRYDGLASLIIYLCLFFLITQYVKKEMIGLFINTIIITACIMSVYGILQYYGIDYFQWSTNYGGRIFGTIGHPGFFSAYLIMVLPLVYYQIIKGRWYFIIALILILTVFYLTKTRASFLGLIISSSCFLGLLGKDLLVVYKYRLISIFSIVLIITVVMSLRLEMNPVSRIVEDIKIEDKKVKLLGTTKARYWNVLVAIEIIKDYPVLGIGYGNINTVYLEYINKVIKKTGGEGYSFEWQDRIHVSPMDTLVRIGILGGLATLWFMYSYGRMMYVHLVNNRILIASLCSAVVAYWGQNLFVFGHVPNLTLLWVLIGLSVISCEKDIVK